MQQRDVPGIDAAYLAMDTEEGMEVVWNEVSRLATWQVEDVIVAMRWVEVADAEVIVAVADVMVAVGHVMVAVGHVMVVVGHVMVSVGD